MMAKPKENPFLLPLIPFNQSSTVPAVVTNPEESLNEFNPAVYCRTCANMDSCLVPIFNGEGLDHELNKKIEKYLPIQISQEDDLPGQLCYHCASTIIAWDTLIIGCLEADKKLKALKDSLRIEHKIELKDEDEISAGDCNISDNLDSDDEPLISKKYVNRKGVKRKTGKKREILQEKTDEQKEIKTDINETKRSNSETKEIDDEKTDCEQCGKIFTSKTRYTKHVCKKKSKITHNDHSHSSVCPICGLLMKSHKGMHKHIIDVHENVERVRDKICEICGFKTHRLSALDKHLKRHMKVKNHFCSICGKGFMYPQAKKDHEARHTEERPFKCEKCTKSFLDSYTLKKHEREAHGDVVPESLMFKCNECNAKFRTLKSLKMHVSWKHDPTFTNVFKFRKREKSEKSELKTYNCPTCLKCFRSKWNFTVHVRIHTGERPYQCRYCDRRFVRNEGRVNHEKKCTVNGLKTEMNKD